MKAIEYSQLYKGFKEDGLRIPIAANEILHIFLEDTRGLLMNRGGSKSAAIGVFREINIKWLAFCKLEPDFKPEGFKEFLMGTELREYAVEM
jgi:hypothetical protein